MKSFLSFFVPEEIQHKKVERTDTGRIMEVDEQISSESH